MHFFFSLFDGIQFWKVPIGAEQRTRFTFLRNLSVDSTECSHPAVELSAAHRVLGLNYYWSSSYTRKSSPWSDTAAGKPRMPQQIGRATAQVVSRYEKRRTRSQDFTFQFPFVFSDVLLLVIIFVRHSCRLQECLCKCRGTLYIWKKKKKKRFCKHPILTLVQMSGFLWELPCAFKGIQKRRAEKNVGGQISLSVYFCFWLRKRTRCLMSIRVCTKRIHAKLFQGSFRGVLERAEFVQFVNNCGYSRLNMYIIIAYICFWIDLL